LIQFVKTNDYFISIKLILACSPNEKEDIMKMQAIAVALTLVNLAIMTFLLTQMRPALAQPRQNVAPVLRGRALEIVDSLGRLRATITLQPPVEVGGKKYPESVLLRLIDARGKPIVKLSAAENGSGLSLVNESDEGVLIHVHNDSCIVKLTNKGKQRVITP
jgi:hypothetical protein